ncbi:MAG: DUF898 family protein [Pseudomonadota bacterium]
MDITYRGTQRRLFWLGAQTAFLTLITLGLYRFWARTRVRRYFWSALGPGGDPLEYMGTGLEKLLGFLIAVAFLAIYLGVFQLLLSFLGLSILSPDADGNAWIWQLGLSQATLLTVVPFVFYAQYRGRRYLLARTRWRGVRFGVEPGVWGYVWRAMVHWLLTVLSVGFLYPRQLFWLEKYRVDRTWYGTAQFSQGGHWTDLIPAARHYFIALAILAAAVLAGLDSRWFLAAIAALVGGFWMLYGLVALWVGAFNILGQRKRLGGTVRFSAEVDVGAAFWVVIIGFLVSSACAGLVFSVITGVVGVILGDLGALIDALILGAEDDPVAALTGGLVAFAVAYVVMVASYGVFWLVFVSQPMLELYASGVEISGAAALDEITQRARDELVEAEGFADALDVGAAV